MDSTLIFSLVAGGAVAGVAAGIFGIGGGAVLIPFLTLVMGYDQHRANGTSLVALLAPVGILGAYTYYRAVKIGPAEMKAGAFIALGIFFGAYFGAKLATTVSGLVLRRLFATLLGVLAIRLWWQK